MLFCSCMRAFLCVLCGSPADSMWVIDGSCAYCLLYHTETQSHTCLGCSFNIHLNSEDNQEDIVLVVTKN